MSVHELLGREAEARCNLHAEYCRLLVVFQEVVSGLVHPARIQSTSTRTHGQNCLWKWNTFLPTQSELKRKRWLGFAA